MNNKIVNIFPDTSEKIINECKMLISIDSDSIYKIFIGFPLLFPYGEEFRPVVLIITTKGIIFFTKHFDKVDNEQIFLQSRLIQHERLRSKTSLRFEIRPVLYDVQTNICDSTLSFLNQFNKVELLDITTMRYIESALTGMLTKRNQEILEENFTEDPTLKSIRQIEYGIATFDNHQYECIEARSNYKISAIRGLAGCGKTVVLCKIAANEIYRNKGIRICYTYQTRSMYGQVKSRIRDFLISSGIDDYETALDRIDIMGAWGGFNNPGLLNKVCHELNLQPLDLEQSRNLNFSNPFLGFCDYVFNFLRDAKLELYDYILIDEAQDLNPCFLRICLSILKNDGKLIYAYDDFQTLSETTLPPPNEIFPDTDSICSFPLSVCYRTPPKILSLAHALSMGIYCEKPTFYQFPSNPSDWEAMGYTMEEGDGTVGKRTVLSRTSPEIYSFTNLSAAQSISPKNGETVFKLLVSQLLKDIKKGLLPEDIIVIDLDGARLEVDYQRLRDEILKIFPNYDESPLKTYFAGSLNPNRFSRKGYITFSGIKRAKGNEAFRVYLLNAAKSMSSMFPIVWRNRLFTAMTRSRLQTIFVNSDDPEQKELTSKLFKEMIRAREHGYKLEFIYPAKSEIQKIIKTAKTEEKIMNEADNISSKLKRLGEIAGDDKKVDLLSEIISSSLSDSDKEKLLEILKEKK